MKKIILLLFCILVSVSIISCEKNNYDLDDATDEVIGFHNETGLDYSNNLLFRGFKYGDSMAYVIDHETAKQRVDFLHVEENRITYNTTINDEEASIYFYFDDADELVAGAYIIENAHKDLAIYMESYTFLKNNLIEAYGNGYKENYDWENDSSALRKLDYGYALSTGKLTINTNWLVENFRITLSHWADSYDVNYDEDNPLLSTQSQNDDLSAKDIKLTKSFTQLYYDLTLLDDQITTDF